MRKIIRTQDWGYEVRAALEKLLSLESLPEFIIIETVEDEE
jgi:hypothetical protein